MPFYGCMQCSIIISSLKRGPWLRKPCLELPGSLTASLEGGVAIIDLHSNHRSARSDLQQVLEHNLSLLIKSHQQKVINESVVYVCVHFKVTITAVNGSAAAVTITLVSDRTKRGYIMSGCLYQQMSPK